MYCRKKQGLFQAEKQLIDELNSLGIKGFAVDNLYLLNGAFVNLTYLLPNGTAIQFLNDNDVYLGCQIEQTGTERCFSAVANEAFILVCEYGYNGTDPEIILYKKR